MIIFIYFWDDIKRQWNTLAAGTMIKNEANVNTKGKDGEKALHYTAPNRDLYKYILWINNGAFTNFNDDLEKTPINYAANNVTNFI